jgi:hypothetical protein
MITGNTFLALTFCIGHGGAASMDLDEELRARMRAAASLDPETKPTDFQVRAGLNGTVLINRRTGKAQLVYDDDSELHDLEDLHIG